MENQVNTPAFNDEIVIQRNYYMATASSYDQSHLHEKDEHYFALFILESLLRFHDMRSVLDIGAGTGRVARFLKERMPGVKVVSVEPVDALRQIGYHNGLSKDELIEGDVNELQFRRGEFDLVCEFGVLHHVKNPHKAVDEMLRVARRGVFLSDSNNFGQGSRVSRAIKQMIKTIGLWGIADFVKTGGKGYTISEGDGLAYSYSVFNNFRQISRACDIYTFNTRPAGMNPYRTASHVALLGVKRS
ncbi:MAG TPA: class I SAM-dependent methyltransferase [Bellilinea sp.]|mgnify:CR=1 FL=1|nr:class I SAM-dependent methyltransferase [Bellilinea sp.]